MSPVCVSVFSLRVSNIQRWNHLLKYICANAKLWIAPQKYEHAEDTRTNTDVDDAAPEPNYYLKRGERMFMGFIFMQPMVVVGTHFICKTNVLSLARIHIARLWRLPYSTIKCRKSVISNSTFSTHKDSIRSIHGELGKRTAIQRKKKTKTKMSWTALGITVRYTIHIWWWPPIFKVTINSSRIVRKS